MKIQVKVTPNSREEGVMQEGDLILVRVKEPPKEGRANRAAIKLIANYFGTSPTNVRIISGHTSRNKLVELKGEKTTPAN